MVLTWSSTVEIAKPATMTTLLCEPLVYPIWVASSNMVEKGRNNVFVDTSYMVPEQSTCRFVFRACDSHARKVDYLTFEYCGSDILSGVVSVSEDSSPPK